MTLRALEHLYVILILCLYDEYHDFLSLQERQTENKLKSRNCGATFKLFYTHEMSSNLLWLYYTRNKQCHVVNVFQLIIITKAIGSIVPNLQS